jgi:2-oxoglutarate ferredoxin oxidoreductase subunit delta
MKLWRKPLNHTNIAASPTRIHIDRERCKGCGYCVEFCPRDVLKMSQELNSKGYLLPLVEDESRCLDCGYCEAICPEFAITFRREITEP